MILSVSNIAWKEHEDLEAYKLLQKYGFRGIDVAPGRVFSSDPYSKTNKDFEDVKELWAKYDLKGQGMQSLLFGKNELEIFASPELRSQTLEYLKEGADFASKIGIHALVFGSPKNRLVRDLSNSQILDIAIPFFSEIADYCELKNIDFLLEPNPQIYGTDWLYKTEDTLDFIKLVNKKGLKLNFDTGTIIANSENPEKIISENIDLIGHVHISVPYLKPVIEANDIHQKIYESLVSNNYQKTVAIEMGAQNEGENLKNLEESLKLVSEIYSI